MEKSTSVLCFDISKYKQREIGRRRRMIFGAEPLNNKWKQAVSVGEEERKRMRGK